jgi:transposase
VVAATPQIQGHCGHSAAASAGHPVAATPQTQSHFGMVIATLFGLSPFLRKLYADSGYQRPLFRAALGPIVQNLQIEIVKRFDTASGFQVLPKRWIVERTIAWLTHCCRLAKDWGNLNFSALSIQRLSSIRLMVRKTFQKIGMFPDRLSYGVLWQKRRAQASR